MAEEENRMNSSYRLQNVNMTYTGNATVRFTLNTGIFNRIDLYSQAVESEKTNPIQEKRSRNSRDKLKFASKRPLRIENFSGFDHACALSNPNVRGW